MPLALIIACEVGFWVVLTAGLAARYVFRRPDLGAALLACVPLVDLGLLIAATVDLTRGATAEWSHGLAAAYIGFSVAFGPAMVSWADERFAHSFAGAPLRPRPPRRGRERARREWGEFAEASLAWAIACGLLCGAIVIVGDPSRTRSLEEWIARLTMVLGIWGIWALSYTLWPVRPRA